MKDHRSLVRQAVVLLDKFQPEQGSFQAFVDNASKSLQDLEESEQNFVLEIISGCVEHRKLLDVVVDTFYHRTGKGFLQADRNQFMVICFLATFLLEDLGLRCFSKIVKCLDAAKMHKFLSFFFNVNNLSTWIRGEWSQIYDAPYVEKSWIAPLLRWQPAVEGIITQLASKAAGGIQPKKGSQKITEPREFALTKPKPRPLPKPEPIPQQERHRPVPGSIYQLPTERDVLEKVKQKNRQQANKVMLDANTQQFHCANPEKSQRTKKVLSRIQEERDAQLQFNSLFSSGIPSSHKTDSPPIRLNTTAILREGALYNRQVEEETRRMVALLSGGGEPSSFLRWQNEVLQQDLQEELAQLERRRLEGLISHEEAALARVRVMERNQQRALLKKEETAELMHRYAEKRLQEEQEMRELVEQVVEGHKNAKEAKAKLWAYKQRIVEEVSEQSRHLLRQALERAQADLARRLELICQIRAMESVPVIRHKFVDDTETAGHALLGEMSLAELRERLALLREAQSRQQEEKRERLQVAKQHRRQWLQGQLDFISQQRAALGEEAKRKQLEKRTRQKPCPGVSDDQQLLELQRKLEDKRQERQRHRQAEDARGKVYGQAAAQALLGWNQRRQWSEENHWEELESSLERQVQHAASASGGLSLLRGPEKPPSSFT
ncbi:cilia- and flagella-associated protein 99 isoform X1 [Brienomyrus brachyistius]|uniref:cilia- and flagella-associated protein 99 isoform X1 n=1 Tax=Brienomyrus brachyistius TaxID=42636 RepID=UPI0020B43119|nr:cilia- and flagella-associated protein 99 isoform X1 [Brienomyrus brachyistius]XP_048851930.1 cilia- and flagella-associated protein 99 isoform X1 [Brienomyrus brachyistius]XP_048851931.1 cilia- and flagella-associated protein 99 isoform X1 [Brienomyrus brachyistius]XP_048851932.1 cilia- and flagella-associated protein 99 isoform X1 [Brienomyrus brachyistius]XP_048851934.1 cilia- and flagella-associated protein 99 isoform X1 [Brienomyrus brachyistius]